MCTGAIVRFLPKLKGEDDVDEDHLFDDEICWEVREGRRERDEVCTTVLIAPISGFR